VRVQSLDGKVVGGKTPEPEKDQLILWPDKVIQKKTLLTDRREKETKVRVTKMQSKTQKE